MFRRLRSEGEKILMNILEMAYFMRGAVQYNDLLLTMSYGERDIMARFLKKRLDAESKSTTPNY